MKISNKHVLSLIVVAFLIFFTAFRIFSIKNFESDTYEYYLNFSNIESIDDIWIYGVEFVPIFIMFMVKYFGFGFNFYLFILFISWIFYFIFMIKKINYTIYMMLCFFIFSTYFFDNLILLQRQYWAALFFLFGISSRGARRWVFFILSVASHLTAIFWIIFFSNLFLLIFKKFKLINIILLLSSVFFIFSMNLNNFLLNFMGYISNFMGIYELNRKSSYYEYTDSVPVPLQYKAAIFLGVFLCFLVMKNNFNKFYVFISVNLFLSLAFSGDVVASSRFGFFGFYFIIPIIISMLYILAGGNIISNKGLRK